MGNPIADMNIKGGDKDLDDLILMIKRECMIELNCHAIATVQTFDKVKQVVTCTMSYTRSYKNRDPVTGKYKITQQDYPILMDLPVVFLRGGKTGMTFPISKGDECVVMFNDRSIDAWFESGQKQAPTSIRMHDISDGFALIGISNMNTLLENFEEFGPCIYNGLTKFVVKDGKFLLKNQVETLGMILQDLIVATTSIATTPGQVAALQAVALRLAGMLE